MNRSSIPSPNRSRRESSDPPSPVEAHHIMTSFDGEGRGEAWILPELEPRYNKLGIEEQRSFRRLGLHYHLQRSGLELIDWIGDTNGNEEPPERYFRALCMDPHDKPRRLRMERCINAVRRHVEKWMTSNIREVTGEPKVI
jgi:hypothetical protein